MKKFLFFVLLFLFNFNIYGTDLPLDYNLGDVLPYTDLNQILGFLTEDRLPVDSGRNYSDDSEDLGSGTYRWNNLFLGGKLNIGDETATTKVLVENAVNSSNAIAVFQQDQGSVTNAFARIDLLGVEGFNPSGGQIYLTDNIYPTYIRGGRVGIQSKIFWATNTGGGNTATEVMALNGSGQLCIGGVTPSATLDVIGDSEFSGDAAFDTNTLFVDVSEDRVGVGTTTPGVKFDVVGECAISQGLDVDTNTLSVDHSNNRVGVGTTAPGYALEVVGDSALDGDSLFVDSSEDRVGINDNTPAYSLDVSGTANMQNDFQVGGFFRFGSSDGISSVTISSGEITISKSGIYSVDPSGGSADGFDTINGGGVGTILILKGSSGNTINVTDNVNLFLEGDFQMNYSRDTIILIKTGAGTPGTWSELSRSNNG